MVFGTHTITRLRAFCVWVLVGFQNRAYAADQR